MYNKLHVHCISTKPFPPWEKEQASTVATCRLQNLPPPRSHKTKQKRKKQNRHNGQETTEDWSNVWWAQVINAFLSCLTGLQTVWNKTAGNWKVWCDACKYCSVFTLPSSMGKGHGGWEGGGRGGREGGKEGGRREPKSCPLN